MTSTWEKPGRDAAHDDIMRGGEPCTTIAEARLRCGAWLRSQPELGVTDADVETCAGAYLRTWRPGKPHQATWAAFYQRAWSVEWPGVTRA